MDLMTKLKIVIKIGRQCQNQNHKLKSPMQKP